MNYAIADKTFGINEQALLVLEYLSHKDINNMDYIERNDNISLVSFTTKPWYNGRETGIVITMQAGFYNGDCMHVAVFEHRNSDELIVLKWQTDYPYFNHPLEDNAIFAKAYHGGGKSNYDKSFEYMRIKECGEYILKEFEIFYRSHHTYENKKQV